MLIDKGTYNVKVTNVEIKVNKAEKKSLMLTLEIQDEGEYQHRKLWLVMAPWSDFNWMNTLKTFFTAHDIETYFLEYRDEDTLWVVSQLILGETGNVKVRPTPATVPPYREYNACMGSGRKTT